MHRAAASDAAPARVVAPARELFIYYKVRGAAAAAALVAVHALQQQLRAEHPALVARLLRRPGEADGLQTWMETYSIGAGNADAPNDEGVDAELQMQIERAAAVLAPYLASPRRLEVFVALDRTR